MERHPSDGSVNRVRERETRKSRTFRSYCNLGLRILNTAEALTDARSRAEHLPCGSNMGGVFTGKGESMRYSKAKALALGYIAHHWGTGI
jgi:hypothetical protein